MLESKKFPRDFVFSSFSRVRVLEAKQAKGKPVSARGSGNDVIIVFSSGDEEIRSGGSRSWRNNNPGNLTSGAFAGGQGAIGSASGFAVFPSENIGFSALIALLNTSTYQNLSLQDAMARYAPMTSNPTSAYVRFIQGQTGILPTDKLSTLGSGKINGLANAIKRFEGWSVGRVTVRHAKRP